MISNKIKEAKVEYIEYTPEYLQEPEETLEDFQYWTALPKLDTKISLKWDIWWTWDWWWFSNEIAFTASDYNTVSWNSWNINLADWKTIYTISAWNTWNMTSTNYLFIDTKISETELQLTTTASESVWKDKILIWVAAPVVDTNKKAIFQAFWSNQSSTIITAWQIAANTITWNEIVSNTITTWEINFGFASSSTKWWKINSWFTSNDISSTTAPSTWVKIDNSWIKMYSWWTEKVSIWANWNAKFAWTIWASTIESTWSIKTEEPYWSSTQYVDMYWWKIDFKDNLYNRLSTFSWTWLVMSAWWTETLQILQNTSWTRYSNISLSYWWNHMWTITSWSWEWLDIWSNSKRVKVLWKLQIPVWTNLY